MRPLKILWFVISAIGCLLFSSKSSFAQPDIKFENGFSEPQQTISSGKRIEADKFGNYYCLTQISGYYDLDPDSNNCLRKSKKGSNSIISKYDSSNHLVSQFVFDNCIQWVDFVVDETGNFLLLGSLSCNSDINPGPDTLELSLANGKVVVCKLDSTGTPLWFNQFTPNNFMSCNYLECTDNFIYLSVKTYDFQLLSQQNVFVRLNSDGVFLDSISYGDFYIYIKPDLAGNIYLRFTSLPSDISTIDFDPGPAVYNMPSTGSSCARTVVCKLDSAWNFIWAKAYGGNSYDLAISATPPFNFYLTGSFSGTTPCDFDPGPANFSLSSNYSTSSYLAKYDSSGNFISAYCLNLNGFSRAILIDSLDNVITYVSTNESGVFDVDYSSGQHLMFLSKMSGVLIKMTDSGSFIAANIIGDSLTFPYFKQGRVMASNKSNRNIYVYENGHFMNGNSSFSRVAVLDSSLNVLYFHNFPTMCLFVSDVNSDENGGIYHTGTFSGLTDLDPGSACYLTTYPNPAFNPYDFSLYLFIRKFDSNYNLQYARTYNIINENNSKPTLFVDAQKNIIIIGQSKLQQIFEYTSGSSTISVVLPVGHYILKVDSLLNPVWIRSYAKNEQVGSNPPSEMVITSTCIDPSGNYYVSGYFKGTRDFDCGPGQSILSSMINNRYDYFLIKLNAFGNYEWVKKFDASFTSSFALEAKYKVVADEFGNTYSAFNFIGPLDLNPDPSVIVMSTACIGSAAYSLIKLDINGNFLWGKNLECGVNQYVPGNFIKDFVVRNGKMFISGTSHGGFDADFTPTYMQILSNCIHGTWSYNTYCQDYVFVASYDTTGSLEWYYNEFFEDNEVATFAFNQNGVIAYGSNIRFIDTIGNPGGAFIYYPLTLKMVSDSKNNFLFNGKLTGVTGYDFDIDSDTAFIFRDSDKDCFFVKYSDAKVPCSIGPIAVVSTALNDTVCEGVAVGLTQIGGQLSASGNFTWFEGACGGIPIGTGSSIVVHPQNTTTYYVQAEDSCGTTTCASVTVNVLPSPATPVISGNTIFCTGDSIILDAGAGYLSYQWSTGSTMQQITVLNHGQYHVSVTHSLNACTAFGIAQVNVHPLPSVSILPAPKVEICEGDSTLLVATYAPYFTYQWFFNNTPVPGATNNTFYVKFNGIYSCEVADTNTCQAVSNNVKGMVVCVLPIDPVGRNETSEQMEFYIIPNPAAETINFRLSNDADFSYILEVSDITGRVIIRNDLPSLKNSLDVSMLPAGVYQVNIQPVFTSLPGFKSRFIKL